VPAEHRGAWLWRPSLEDTDLIARACQGDVEAYEPLVVRYQDVAFRAAYLILRDAAEAEEATQDAFVKAYGALPRFRPEAAFRPWLLRIVTNEARNRRKSASRRASLSLRAADVAAATQSAPSPEGQVLAAEDRRLVLRALDALREEDRLVIAYRYFLDLTEAETAEALGCPRGTVKSRLSRALGRLREQVLAVEAASVGGVALRSVQHG